MNKKEKTIRDVVDHLWRRYHETPRPPFKSLEQIIEEKFPDIDIESRDAAIVEFYWIVKESLSDG